LSIALLGGRLAQTSGGVNSAVKAANALKLKSETRSVFATNLLQTAYSSAQLARSSQIQRRSTARNAVSKSLKRSKPKKPSAPYGR